MRPTPAYFLLSTLLTGVSLCRLQRSTVFSRLSVRFRKNFVHMSTRPTLDRSTFDTNVRLVALKIPAKECNSYLTVFQAAAYSRPKMKKVYPAPDESDKRLLLLSEQYQDLNLRDLPADLREFNEKHGGLAQEYVLNLGYEHLGADEVLRRILPSDVKEVPSSFEQAGHLAHLNLRDEALPYKHLIGQVLMDKNPTIKTVVNKIGNIETEFRTFPMELLAGEENYEVTVRESQARFTFNFAQVYWNSRLQMEHGRLVGIIQQAAGYKTSEFRRAQQGGKGPAVLREDGSAPGQPQPSLSQAQSQSQPQPQNQGYKAPPLVVADMMAGVGPFAVPLAMPLPSSSTTVTTAEREIIVHANDLNPASYKYLEQNAKLNHCTPRRLRCYNMDGRHFILKLVAENQPFEHAIMNLPQNATDFLDVFIGLQSRLPADRAAGWATLPRIHVYAFSTLVEDPIGDIIRRSAGVLRCSADALYPGAAGGKYEGPLPQCEGHIVRDVAPKKVMVCLSFTLPHEVANAEPLEFVSRKRDSTEAGLESEI